MNSSLFICERLIFFNDIISSLIQEVGYRLLDCPINFSSLFDKINSMIIIEQNNFNIFSIDGILKAFYLLVY